MNKQKDWKYYLGMALFIGSFLPYIFVFVVLPFLSLPVSSSLSLASILLVSAEVMFVLSVMLLGKAITNAIKQTIGNIFGKVWNDKPVGETRHAIGVVLLLLSLVYPTVITEIVLFFRLLDIIGQTNLIMILFSGDVMFMVSFFVLGSNFFQKLKQLLERSSE